LENYGVDIRKFCPRCGGKPIIKNPYSDRVQEGGVGGGVSVFRANSNIKISPNPQKEEYYICNGCNLTYVGASMDFNLIIKHLGSQPNIAVLVQHYYGKGITLTDLITSYCTGIVRSYHSRLNFITSRLAKRTLYICFNCNGIRTFGILKRLDDVTNTYSYALTTLEVPKL